MVKNPPANAGDARDVGLFSGLGRSPGRGNGKLSQYPCLGNPMDRGAWSAAVRGITDSDMTEGMSTHRAHKSNIYAKLHVTDLKG